MGLRNMPGVGGAAREGVLLMATRRKGYAEEVGVQPGERLQTAGSRNGVKAPKRRDCGPAGHGKGVRE